MRLLAFWAYHRAGMREFLHNLPPDIEVHYLFFRDPSEDPSGQGRSVGRSYWSDYRDAQDVLDQVRPDKVLFLGIDSLWTIALNRASQARNIPTIFLQHGLFFGNEDAAGLQTAESLGAVRWQRLAWLFRSALFYYRRQRGAGWGYLTFPLRFYLDRLKRGTLAGLTKHQDGFRIADWYLVFTLHEAQPWLSGRHGVALDRAVEIGNPTFDDFFREEAPSLGLPPYYLLVDQPLTESGLALKTAQEHQSFYSRLAQFAQRRGCLLVIKLHPDDYARAPSVAEANVQFVRQAENLTALVRQSSGVFGFFSTLLIPAIALRPCCLFRLGADNALLRDVSELGLGAVMNYGDDPASQDWDGKEKPAEGLAEFERRYLYRADGLAKERLIELLRA